MNTLLDFIQMVLSDMKEQVMKQSLSTVMILIHSLTVIQTGILFSIVVGISERQQ